MSRERDLLRKLFEAGMLDRLLAIEVGQLLAQPEQEPVGIVRTIGGYPDNSQHTVELTGRHGDLRDGDLLYKAPPKREPLSEEWIKNNRHFIHQDVSFTELVRGIEKAHGIGVDDE